MSFNMKVLVDSKEFSKTVEKFKNETTEIIQNSLDLPLTKDITMLKEQLKNTLTGDFTVLPVDLQKTAEIEQDVIKINKTRREYLDYLVGEELEDTINSINKNQYKVSVEDDNSLILFSKNGFIQANQTVNDSDTAMQQLRKFQVRLEQGVVVDLETGRIVKLKKQDIKFLYLKIFCSSGAPGSEKQTFTIEARMDQIRKGLYEKFLKNGTAKGAPITMYRENSRKAIENGLDLTNPQETGLVDELVRGNIEEAKQMLNKNQQVAEFLDLEEKIDNLDQNKDLPDSLETHRNLHTLVENLKIKKEIKKEKTEYTLVSSYDKLEEKLVDFIKEVKIISNLWKKSNIENWIKHIAQQVVKIIKINFK